MNINNNYEMEPVQKKAQQIKATFLKQEIEDFGKGFDVFLNDLTNYVQENNVLFKKIKKDYWIDKLEKKFSLEQTPPPPFEE